MERDATVDIAKGYDMILVIAGHLFEYGSYPFRFIFCFHMPLFFFLSGFLFTFEKYPNTTYLMNKIFRSMITTYLFFTIIGFVMYMISGRLVLDKHLWYSLFFKGQPDICGSLWFITCLTLVYTVFYYVFRKIREKSIIWIFLILFICLLVELLLIRTSKIAYLPFKLETVPIALVFFVIGYYCNVNRWISYVKFKWSVIAFSLLTIVAYINSTVNICVPTLGNVFLFVIASFSGIYFVLTISKHTRSSLLCFIGKNSLIIFLMDEFIRYYYLKMISSFSDEEYIAMINVPIIYCIIGTVIVLLSCAFCVKIISPVYQKFVNELTSFIRI